VVSCASVLLRFYLYRGLEVSMYAPRLSEFATVSVRRLSWALGVSIPAAVNIMLKLTSCCINSQKICLGCQDKTKCTDCLYSPSMQKDALVNFNLTEKEQTALLAVQ
jgi:hypothetical protein